MENTNEITIKILNKDMKKIPLIDNYFIDENGLILYNSKTNQIFLPNIIRTHKATPYAVYNIKLANEEWKTFPAHRLVCMAYNSLPKENQLDCNHIDGNTLNNNFKNLEWVTHKENMNMANTKIKFTKLYRKLIGYI